MQKWFGVVGVVAVLGMATGCTASLAQLSSGEVGCLPSKVEITNVETHWSNKTWTATCQGQRFHCSGAESRGKYSSSIHIACSPEGGARAVAQAAPAKAALTAEKARPPAKVMRDYDEATGTQLVKASFGIGNKAAFTMAVATARAMGVIQVAYEARSAGSTREPAWGSSHESQPASFIKLATPGRASLP